MALARFPYVYLSKLAGFAFASEDANPESATSITRITVQLGEANHGLVRVKRSGSIPARSLKAIYLLRQSAIQWSEQAWFNRHKHLYRPIFDGPRL